MNDKMTDILKLARIQLILIPLFVFFKVIRPTILDSTSPEIFKIILLSLPNFFESVTGTLVFTGIGLLLNDRLHKKHQIRPKNIYTVAVLLAGIFVITQELNFLNFRGDNIFDQNDVIFSSIGLLIGYWIVLRIKPRVHYDTSLNNSKTD